jgi:phage tail sheath protein FI
MPIYLAPGVYFERADAVVPAITALRTDIAAFVGIAERGPLHTAVPVQSWRQFQATFGSFIAEGYLAYAAKAFFENGGHKCYVVRVAPREVARSASATFTAKSGNSAWSIEASSPGRWGNQLAAHLHTTHRAQTRTVVEPYDLDRTISRVESVAHFERGTLVRLFQPGAPPVEPLQVLQVVAAVDGARQRLIWKAPLDAAFTPGVPLYVESIEYTLTLYWRGRVVAIYENLSLVPEHRLYAPDVVRLSPLQRSDVRDDILPPPPPLVMVSEVKLPSSLDGLALDIPIPRRLEGGWDGLDTLTASDFIGEPEDLLDSDEEKNGKRRGLRVLEAVDEVSIVAVPDIHIRPAPPPRIAPLPPPEHDVCLLGPQPPPLPAVPPVVPEQPPTFSDEQIAVVQNALVAHCEERRDRFALLDPPFSAARDDALGTGAVMAWRSRFESKYAALYYPWLRVLDPLRLRGQVVREIPPSGHVAGLVARTDIEIGVHKAPANAELRWLEDITVSVDDAAQAGLNPRGINTIRSFAGRGIRLYGARTVSSDPDWRYVNVRRLVMMIEEALDVMTQWAVFEPNNLYTRNKVRLAVTTFLETLWRRGALAGAQPEQAFFVRCDEDNNPSEERELGRLRVDVGVAPSLPYEFIVLRVGRTAEELEVVEQ